MESLRGRHIIEARRHRVDCTHPWTRSYIYWLLTAARDNTVIDAYHCSHCNFIDPPSHSTKGYGDGRLRQVSRLPRTAGAISMSGRGSFVARPCCLFHISCSEQHSAALKIRSPSLKRIINNDSPHNLLQKAELQVESNLQFFLLPRESWHHFGLVECELISSAFLQLKTKCMYVDCLLTDFDACFNITLLVLLICWRKAH